MPQFLAFLQQWGPWLLMAWGVVTLISSTILYEGQLRLLRKLIESPLVEERLNDPRLPAYYPRLFRWCLGLAQHRWLQWASIACAGSAILAGVVWLLLRYAP